MSNILDVPCYKCGKYEVIVLSYWDKEYNKRYVDHGLCRNCLKIHILPQEIYGTFVRENCL